MAPAFAQFEQKYKSKISIVKVDVSDAASAEKFRSYKSSRYIPETVLIHNGKIVTQQTGAMSLAQLEELLTKSPP